MSLSIGCLAAIAIVVRAYDGESMPSTGITLNTVVSILSTTARSGLVFVVSTMMGQFKWTWLQRPDKRIKDTQTLDAASRGPLGATRVLFFWTGGSLAVFGGVITLLTVAFSPFLQQLLVYPLRNVTQPASNALAPRVLAYTGLFKTETVTMNASSILEAGTWSTQKQKPFDQDASCPSSRCSWDKFKSIGWCTKCGDRTHSATIKNCNFDAYIQNRTQGPACVVNLGAGAGISLLTDVPNNQSTLLDGDPTPALATFSLNFTSESIWPVSYGDFGMASPEAATVHTYRQSYQTHNPLLYENDTSFIDAHNPLIVFGYLKASVNPEVIADRNRKDVDFLRVEKANLCFLTLCEKELSVSKEEGISHWTEGPANYGNLFIQNRSRTYHTERLWSSGTWYGGDARQWNYSSVCWKPEEEPVALTTNDDGYTFIDEDRRAFCPIELYSTFIGPYLTGNVTQHIQITTYFPLIGGVIREEFLTFPDEWSSSSETVGPSSTRNLTERLESIAVALTNHGLETTNDTASGFAFRSETYVHVRRQWLVPPVVLELASLLFFILAITHSRREGVPIWKSSVLAFIYHGVDELRDRESLDSDKLSDMEAAAKITAVQLRRNDEGLRYLSARKIRQVAASESIRSQSPRSSGHGRSSRRQSRIHGDGNQTDPISQYTRVTDEET